MHSDISYTGLTTLLHVYYISLSILYKYTSKVLFIQLSILRKTNYDNCKEPMSSLSQYQ